MPPRPPPDNSTYFGSLNVLWFIISGFCMVASYVGEDMLGIECNIESWVHGLTSFILIAFTLRVVHDDFSFQSTIRTHLLSSVFATGIYGAIYWSDVWKLMGWYLCVLSFFHFSEFISIAFCNPKSLSVSSFILYHSGEYWIALIASWIEFTVESIYCPWVKTDTWISWIGLGVCIFGESLRKTAMFTAATNFNHLVQLKKDDDHVLVTHGIYGLCRHPSYLGWYIWSIGTQLMLLNPICTLVYTLVSWNFFRERILVEEMYLISFFREEYRYYQKRVGTGLPFIKGLLGDAPVLVEKQ